ncbi:MAG: hypothetical protein HQK85_06000 [Nitrospinae bacterium]|nr:hypothetical protein [Nitrospinota bacterium]
MTSLDMADLKGSYERIMKGAPRRHNRDKRYFIDGHDGVPSTKGGTNRNEEHLAIALWNRFGPGKTPITLPDGISLTLLDYQFPLKERQDDKGVGKVDLFGVTSAGQAWVIELKQGANRTDTPSAALLQALGYAAMVQANMDDIGSEPKGKPIRESIPAVCVMAPEGYWYGQTAELAELNRQVEAELDVPVRFVAIKMSPDALILGLNGNKPRLNGDIEFEYVEAQSIGEQIKDGFNMIKSFISPRSSSNGRADSQGRAYKGSQLQIQIYVNRRAEELNTAICAAYPALKDHISWVSPLKNALYEEYKDEDFLRSVGMSRLAPLLVGDFWPKGGPRWDALARVKINGKEGVILVEAKNYPGEIEGNGCGASPYSRSIIEKALQKTKKWLGVAPETDWMGKWYQSANRLAHLYFLNEVVGVPAWLVNVHILDDPMHNPTSRNVWEIELAGIKSQMGLSGVAVPHLVDVFMPAHRREELD